MSHDQEEALTMSDTIVVMNDGVIQQIGTPIDIYNEPKNAFVANFIGESNIYNGHERQKPSSLLRAKFWMCWWLSPVTIKSTLSFVPKTLKLSGPRSRCW